MVVSRVGEIRPTDIRVQSVPSLHRSERESLDCLDGPVWVLSQLELLVIMTESDTIERLRFVGRLCELATSGRPEDMRLIARRLPRSGSVFRPQEVKIRAFALQEVSSPGRRSSRGTSLLVCIWALCEMRDIIDLAVSTTGAAGTGLKRWVGSGTGDYVAHENSGFAVSSGEARSLFVDAWTSLIKLADGLGPKAIVPRIGATLSDAVRTDLLPIIMAFGDRGESALIWELNPNRTRAVQLWEVATELLPLYTTEVQGADPRAAAREDIHKEWAVSVATCLGWISGPGGAQLLDGVAEPLIQIADYLSRQGTLPENDEDPEALGTQSQVEEACARFRFEGSRFVDLPTRVLWLQEAVDLYGVMDQERHESPVPAYQLSFCHLNLVETSDSYSEQLESATEALKWANAAVQRVQRTPEDPASYRLQRAKCLNALQEVTGDPTDLNDAIAAYQAEVDLDEFETDGERRFACRRLAMLRTSAWLNDGTSPEQRPELVALHVTAARSVFASESIEDSHWREHHEWLDSVRDVASGVTEIFAHAVKIGTYRADGTLASLVAMGASDGDGSSLLGALAGKTHLISSWLLEVAATDQRRQWAYLLHSRNGWSAATLERTLDVVGAPGSGISDSRVAMAAFIMVDFVRGIWLTHSVTMQQGRNLQFPAGFAPNQEQGEALSFYRSWCSYEQDSPDDLLSSRRKHQCVKLLRDIPGWERLDLPPSLDASGLTEVLGVNGASVMLLAGAPMNAWAIVLRPAGARAVPLPEATAVLDKGLSQLYRSTIDCLDGLNEDAVDHALRVMLRWMGLAIIQPLAPGLQGVTRVWWIPAGCFDGLPLHAAFLDVSDHSVTASGVGGSHAEGVARTSRTESGSWETVDALVKELEFALMAQTAGDVKPESPAQRIDNTICSYTASLGLLAAMKTPTLSSARVAAGVNKSRSFSSSGEPVADLKTAESEARAVFEMWDADQGRLLVGDEATASEVLDYAGHAQVFHFAGHAEPSESAVSAAIHCADGPVTLGQLAAAKGEGGLAFLSGCHSGVSTGLSSEMISLTSAMQAIGYRHAIGTVTTIHDQPALEMSELIHSLLVGEDDVPPAVAVHEAMLTMRRRYDSPLWWAHWVHFGP